MKKGFTLIELLAVIVILAIVALIATPLILNVIDDSKRGAFKSTAYGIIQAAELNYAQNVLNGVKEEKSYVYENGEQVSSQDTILEFKGNKPQNGEIKTNADGKVAMAIYDGKYCAEKSFSDSEITISETSQEDCVVLTLPNSDRMCGEIFIDPRDNEEYKTVKIGNRCWMAEDLRYTGNGCLENAWNSTGNACRKATATELQNNPTRRDWLEKIVWYQYNVALGWDGINPASPADFEVIRQGVCPDGWHIPSYTEFAHLRGYEAVLLKSDVYWDGTNELGFGAFPAGHRYDTSLYQLGSAGFWWINFYAADAAWGMSIKNGDPTPCPGAPNTINGTPIRCVISAE